MPVSNEDVTVWRHHDRRRRVELVGAIAGDAGLAQRQQYLAVGTELEHLVALAVLAEPVGDPHVALAVDGEAMRKKEEPGAEALHQRAGGIELEDRWQARAVAGERRARFHQRGRRERSAAL